MKVRVNYKEVYFDRNFLCFPLFKKESERTHFENLRLSKKKINILSTTESQTYQKFTNNKFYFTMYSIVF